MHPSGTQPHARRGLARGGAVLGLALAGVTLIGAALAQDGVTPLPDDEEFKTDPCVCKQGPDPEKNCPLGLMQCKDSETKVCCPVSLDCIKLSIHDPFPPGCFRL